MSDPSDILGAYVESIRKYGGDYRFFSGGNEPNILHDEFDFEIDSSSSESESDSSSTSSSESEKEDVSSLKSNVEKTDVPIVGSSELTEETDTKPEKKPMAMYMVINVDCKDIKDEIKDQEKNEKESIYAEIRPEINIPPKNTEEVVTEEKKYGSNDSSYNLSSDQLVDIIKNLEI